MVNPDNHPKYPLIPKHLDYPSEPLYSILDRSVEKYPNNQALTLETGSFDKIGSMTYKELGEASDKFAAFLKDKNIGPGDKVAVFLPNMIEFVVAYYGILKAGAAIVSLNFQYPARELEFQLIDSEAKGIVCGDMITSAAEPYETCKKVRDLGTTPLEFIVVASVTQYLSKLKGFLSGVIKKRSKKDNRDIYFHEIYANYSAADRPKITPPQPNDMAVLMYTGGTTGTPKGAMLSHRNLLANIMQGSTWLDPPPKMGTTVVMGSLPFYHSFGATTAQNISIYFAGNTILMMDPREGKFDQLLHLIQKYKVEVFCSVPSLYQALLNHPKLSEYDVTSLLISVSGAAPMPVATLNEYERTTGANLAEGYGLTETSPITSANPMVPWEEGGKPLKKSGSVGVPFPDTEVLIVDIEKGETILETNQEGEIAITGPQVMLGYYKKEKETADVMRNINNKRFFLTGDIGKQDEDGYTFITDRKKDMIDVSGFKAYPREIEEVLIGHDKVSSAAVIGVPHPKVGETVKAFLVLKPGETATVEEIKEYCEENLVKYKRPYYVEFRTELPMTQVGKVLRRALREEEEAK
ncbi:MAG: AMP-binding protein [Candidatus Hodarchaeales archaeon]|jgi:long-chain acyl-CoA synthetase